MVIWQRFLMRIGYERQMNIIMYSYIPKISMSEWWPRNIRQQLTIVFENNWNAILNLDKLVFELLHNNGIGCRYWRTRGSFLPKCSPGNSELSTTYRSCRASR